MRYVDFKKILVPVDLSDASFAAVDAALELVENPNQIMVLHVLPILTDFEAGLSGLPEDEGGRSRLALRELRKRLTPRKYSGVDIRAVIGDPVYAITTVAKDKGATLIVMPSHGRTGFRHLMMGSIAEGVLRHADCPVLVLKHVMRKVKSEEAAKALQTAAKQGHD